MYRGDLRELNEINFARFDAKVEQRFAGQDAKWEKRFAELEVRWEKRLAELEVRWERRFAELRADMHALHASQMRWMFAMWVTAIAAIVGLYSRG